MAVLGIHSFVFTSDRSPEALSSVADRARRSGFDLVELPLLDATGLDVPGLAAVFARHDLQVTCSAGLTAASDISSGRPDSVERGRELLARAVDVAARLGSRYLTGVLYSDLTRYLGPSAPAGRAACVTVLAETARLAGRHGVTLGLEPVNRYETNFLNTAAQAVELVEEIGEPNVVVHLDTFHMNIEEDGFQAPVLETGARLGYVHVGESNRGPIGRGTVAFDAFFEALGRIGYDGPIVFEAFSRSVSAGALAPALALWRDTWSDPDEIASSAHAFLERALRAEARGS